MSAAASRPDAPAAVRPFASPAAIAARAARRLRPPARVPVAEAMERVRYVRNPGGGTTGWWSNADTPYLVEPMNATASRRWSAVVFVGPAQCGKTDGLVLNPIAFAVTHDPADMMVVQTTQATARDFSRRRVARMNRDSHAVGKRLLPGGSADNVLDKSYEGMLLSLAHPAVTELSGKPIPRVILTDYDRMPEDVDGEGSPFALARKRSQTFGSRGMTVAESSPGRVITDPKWKPDPTQPHRAPPATGIAALYNAGTRARWCWPCPHCGAWFEGRFEHLSWPEDTATHAEAAAEAVMVCPESGCIIEPRAKHAMNLRGLWLAEGQEILADGTVTGTARRSSTASYWLQGVAAAFSTWPQLVEKWLDANADYAATGSEETLKAVTNADLGEAYLPKAAEGESSLEADALVQRVESWDEGTVPAGAAFLTVAVDVQKHHFDVLVRAWGRGLESWPVARWQIFEADGGARQVDPARHLEDWLLLIPQVLERAWPIEGGGAMEPLAVMIDSGGAPGVTERAYELHWHLARTRHPKRARVNLYKGTTLATAPRLAMSLPDSKRKDRRAKARGEVPVWFGHSDLLKDALFAQLSKAEAGPLYYHQPAWLLNDRPPHDWFEELTAETRNAKGRWLRTKKRNEATDLSVMTHAAALRHKADRIDWDRPPAWADAAGANPLIIAGSEAPTRAPAADGGPHPSPEPGIAPAAADQEAAPPRPRRRRGRGTFVNGWRP